MITALLAGAIIGFILALPPGPIAMANIRMSLGIFRKDPIFFSAGTAFMDILFCIAVVFAASAIQSAVNSHLDNYPFIWLFFQFIVVGGLIYFGIMQLKSKTNKKTVPQKPEKLAPGFIARLKNKGPLFLGIALAFTNLANPSFVPSLTIMSAWVHEIGIFKNAFFENILFSIGFGAGNFIWLYLLSYIVFKNRHKLSENSIMRIKQFAGVTFIGFGGFLGYRILTFTNWAQLFKFIVAL